MNLKTATHKQKDERIVNLEDLLESIREVLTPDEYAKLIKDMSLKNFSTWVSANHSSVIRKDNPPCQ